jgi:hypothetical protein
MQLGRIVPVEIRTIWKSEAVDFTPWLAEAHNLNLLGEALHLGELSLQTTEFSVGDFSADIVAVDEGGVQVLIENQLEPTDHRHLGQVLTYLAGLNGDEAIIVWVATQFRQEHRAAIDWLNRQTAEGFDFFGVEIDVIRIADSPPAPRFNVVAMPNDWAKQARHAARRVSSERPSETGVLYQQYWQALHQAAEGAGEGVRFPKAWPRHWLPLKIGRSGFMLGPVLQRSANQVRVELYMRQKNMRPKQAFRALEAAKTEIETEYGALLEWEELPGRRASRVATYLKGVDIADRGDWPRQHRWIIEQLQRFRTVFKERVKALAFDYFPEDEAQSAEAEEHV